MSRKDFLKGAFVLGVGAALGGGLSACGSSGSQATTTASGAKAVRGGKLTVAYIGGGSSETLNPNAPVADIDDARTLNLYESMFRLDADLNLEYLLAESAEPNADGSQWTIRLRSGVTFHDGSAFGADDVIYTLKRIADPKNAANQQALVSSLVDVPSIKKLDNLTIRLSLKTANVFLPYLFYDDSFSVVKEGWVNSD
ncbi:MAG: ABC transporter substrate-binding protein, partial [Acidimicrobiales bacterium]